MNEKKRKSFKLFVTIIGLVFMILKDDDDHYDLTITFFGIV